jgi:hypothetical protein
MSKIREIVHVVLLIGTVLDVFYSTWYYVTVAVKDILSFCLYSQKHTGLYTWTLYRSYFKGIGSNIELQAYSVMCC